MRRAASSAPVARAALEVRTMADPPLPLVLSGYAASLTPH